TGLSGAVPVEDRDFYHLLVVLAGSALKIRSTWKIRSLHPDPPEHAKPDSIRAYFPQNTVPGTGRLKGIFYTVSPINDNQIRIGKPAEN
ncbi:MAG: hypothetical protein Q7T80_08860, partial [Methanoregula sp.]|nr:hypothetical protein [Methanoregula sp.]